MNIGDTVHVENSGVFSVNIYHRTFFPFLMLLLLLSWPSAVFCLAWQTIINSGLTRNVESGRKTIYYPLSQTQESLTHIGKLWLSDDNYETFKTSKSWIMADTSNLTSLSDYQCLLFRSWSLWFWTTLDYFTLIPNYFSLFEI